MAMANGKLALVENEVQYQRDAAEDDPGRVRGRLGSWSPVPISDRLDRTTTVLVASVRGCARAESQAAHDSTIQRAE
jgi:phosphoribosylamine-glycine ligase